MIAFDCITDDAGALSLRVTSETTFGYSYRGLKGTVVPRVIAEYGDGAITASCEGGNVRLMVPPGDVGEMRSRGLYQISHSIVE